MEKLEDQLKDTNLKIFEQGKEMEMLKKKFRVLKEKEKQLTDLEVNLEKLEKKVDNFKVSHIVETKCKECDFVAKNELGLKVHIKAKHTEPERFKCFKCDFSASTKSDLTDHNDVYWYSHRMCLDSRRKREYLEEFEQLKTDGFTVKESIYNTVIKWDD